MADEPRAGLGFLIEILTHKLVHDLDGLFLCGWASHGVACAFVSNKSIISSNASTLSARWRITFARSSALCETFS